MSLALTTALAAVQTVASCSWNEPGHNPYMGTMSAAVERYTDIPAPVRQKLRERMAVHAYDDLVAIRRDSITGRHRYAPELKQMHFGAGQVCGRVDRARWSDGALERGLVYCESGHCLVVPTVCRNVSRVQRLPDDPKTAGGGGGAGSPPLLAAGPGTPTPMPPTDPLAGDGELTLPPTGAGSSFVEVAQFDPSTPVVFLGIGATVAGSPPLASDGGSWFAGGGGGAGFGPGRPDTGVDPLLPGGVPGGPAAPTTPADPVPPAGPTDPTAPTTPPAPLDPPDPPQAVLPDPVPPAMTPRDWGPFRPDGWVPELVPELVPETGPVTPIPEPGRALLMLAGVLALAALRRRRR
jgi:hypothetical protein